MNRQRTIANGFTVKGKGLHSGSPVEVTFKPAVADSGVVFIRKDLPGQPEIKATAESALSVARSPRRTTVVNGNAEVQTIEHLMASLSGLGIDNIRVEINNTELPGLDGSSMDFADAFMKAGVVEQEKERRYCLIREALYAEEEDAAIVVVPSRDFRISYTLNYEHPLLKAQFMEFAVDGASFREMIAPARTFCLQDEVEELQRQGFGKGATYENTLVVGNDGIIKNKLRFPDEFIRHKILDLLGDLYLLGEQIKGHVIALRSGHSLNLQIVRKIMEHKRRFELAGVSAGYHPKDAGSLDVDAIMKILPHREPFLFVDRIISLEKGKRAVGVKNVTINDYFFRGHFPGKPVMPGVLIIEAMAQVGGVMMLAPEENQGKIAYFMAADNVKFRKTVVPGDQLVMEVEAGKLKSKTGKVHARAYVDGRVVAEADLMFALAES